MASIHDGHRARMRRRVINESLDYFEEHEVLEMILYYVMRQGDTSRVAHEMINRFGSLANALDADRSKLEEINGISENVSFFLNLVPQICRRYMMSRAQKKEIKGVNNSDLAHEILAPYFIGRVEETLYVLCLNSMGEPIECDYISSGTVNATSINIRKIISVVVRSNASAVILCHNHPSGIARPSRQDIVLTKKLAVVLETMNVALLDHLIIADGDFVSFYDSEKQSIIAQCDDSAVLEIDNER